MKLSVILAVLLALAPDIGQSLSDVSAANPKVRAKAVDALGKSKAGDALLPLIECLHDPESDVRLRAIVALGELGDRQAIPALQDVVSSKEEPQGHQRAARQALEKLGPVGADDKDWLENCRRWAVIGDEVVELPKFDFQYDSSRGVTTKQARAKGWGGAIGKRPERYARAIPKLAVGEFGNVPACTILQVLGSDAVLVHKVAALDRPKDTIIKLVGFDTSGLVDDQLWTGTLPPDDGGKGRGGVNIAIIGTTKYVDVVESERTVLLACPVSWIRRGLTPEQVEKFMAKP